MERRGKTGITQTHKHTHTSLQPVQGNTTSPFGLPAQSPFPFKFLLEFPFLLLRLNWSTASLSTASSPPPPPPSSPVFSPCSFISSRVILNWARVRTIWSIRSGPCAWTHTHTPLENTCRAFNRCVYSHKPSHRVRSVTVDSRKNTWGSQESPPLRLFTTSNQHGPLNLCFAVWRLLATNDFK